MKKPRHSKINFVLPDHFAGVDEVSLESVRAAIKKKLKKKNFNMSLINQKMEVTFSA